MPNVGASAKDWKALRALFPLSHDRTYLNIASLGPSPQKVIDHMFETIQSQEEVCRTRRYLANRAHAKLEALLQAPKDSIAIMRNATEGANIVARSIPLQAGDEVIITDQEHIGGAAPWITLQQQIGIKLTVVPLDLSGHENFHRLRAAITDKTKVMVFSHVTCTTGMLLPVAQLTSLCREQGIYSCVDGAQAVGMLPVSINQLRPDFYFASGHKWLFGPKGTGILYMNPEIMEALQPSYTGAYTDAVFDLAELEQSYRMVAIREEYGTRSMGLVAGLEAAVDFITELGIDRIEARGRALQAYVRAALQEIDEVEFLSPEDSQWSSAILTFRVRGVDFLTLQKHLDSKQALALRAIYEAKLNALRISCGVINDEQELDRLVACIQRYLAESH